MGVIQRKIEKYFKNVVIILNGIGDNNVNVFIYVRSEAFSTNIINYGLLLIILLTKDKN